MTRRQVRESYKEIQLTQQEKQALLRKILSESNRVHLCGKDTNMRKRTFRPAVIVAIVALMVLLMGCAWAVINLEDLVVGEYIYQEDAHVNQDGEAVPETDKTRNLVSLQGIAGTPNQLAAQEWYEFEQDYCMNHADKIENLFQRPDDYQAYGVGNHEMVDKVDEICKKYGLAPAGKFFYAEAGEMDFLCDSLKLDSIVTDGGKDVEYLGGYFYACGNFKVDLSFSISYQEEHWQYPIFASIRYADKDYLDTVLWTVDPETVEQWNYTCEDGTQVLLVTTGDRGAILCNREDAFLYVGFSTLGYGETGVEDTMTRRDMELIAEAVDFYVKPVKPDMDAVESLYRKIEEKRSEEQEIQENMPEPWEKESYAEVLEFSPWDYFALKDITGDGMEELLIGMDEDRFFWGFTMEDKVTKSIIQTGYDLFICENGFIESFLENDEVIIHRYYQFEDGKFIPVDYLEYNKAAGSWGKDLDGDEWTDVEITEEEAMQIVNSYKRITLEMKPVSEFSKDQ